MRAIAGMVAIDSVNLAEQVLLPLSLRSLKRLVNSGSSAAIAKSGPRKPAAVAAPKTPRMTVRRFGVLVICRSSPAR
ncbi:hypothetical protein [Mesorhizobium sp. M0195]|uniref:hypothetical protein n=1 Tax=Mesorhizobium sp. M0195 TaxID=2956910 RepID=UPI00333CFC3A